MRPKMLLLATVVVLLLPAGMVAQEGLFQRGVSIGNNNTNGLMDKSESTIGSNFTGQGFGSTNGSITGQTFGAPLNGGLLVLLAMGAGYATIKSKKKQNRKEK